MGVLYAKGGLSPAFLTVQVRNCRTRQDAEAHFHRVDEPIFDRCVLSDWLGFISQYHQRPSD